MTEDHPKPVFGTIADVCVGCGWFYRRPVCQSYRMYCRACEERNGQT